MHNNPARDPATALVIKRCLEVLEGSVPDCGVVLVVVPVGPAGSTRDSMVATNLSPLATGALLRSVVDTWRGSQWDFPDLEPDQDP